MYLLTEIGTTKTIYVRATKKYKETFDEENVHIKKKKDITDNSTKYNIVFLWMFHICIEYAIVIESHTQVFSFRFDFYFCCCFKLYYM